jgi:phospholipid/cholesterol/gamma-HCH transport system substrate-binding protein
VSTNADRVKAGMFVVVCLGVFAAMLIAIAGIKFFRRDDEYLVAFSESVSGLDEGSIVTYKGVHVGRVKDIHFDPSDDTQVEATIALRPGVTIRVDAKASIRSQGITGLNFIEITGGTSDAPALPPGGHIRSEPSLFGTITDKFPQLLQNMEVMTKSLREFFDEKNRDHVRSILENLDRSLASGRAPLDDGIQSFRHAAADFEAASSKLRTLVDETDPEIRSAIASLRRTAASADSLVGGEDVAATLRDLRSAAGRIREWTDSTDPSGAIGEVTEAARSASKVMARIDGVLDEDQGHISATLRNLRESTAVLDEILRGLRDDPASIFSSPKQPTGNGPK